jgi:hypothetical protein
MRQLLFALSVVAIGTACSDGVTGPEELSGVYVYHATDSAGTLLLTGTLQMVFQDDSSVTGSWGIEREPDAGGDSEVGPQIGEGTLQGRLSAEGLVLDLNPGSADNNVLLIGALVRDAGAPKLAGDWRYSAFAGEVAAGHFTATRLPSAME